jgi:chromosome segregation ATPase
MVTLDELERRVTALEDRQDRTADEISAIKRDLRKLALLHGDMLDQVEALNRRMAALELAVAANARTTEAGFANVQAQISALDAKFEARMGRIEAEQAALRRDLPGMLVAAIRDARSNPDGE